MKWRVLEVLIVASRYDTFALEDEIPFYSSLLPQIYLEVTSQTTRLMAEGLNLSHRLLRIRARDRNRFRDSDRGSQQPEISEVAG